MKYMIGLSYFGMAGLSYVLVSEILKAAALQD